MKTKGKLGWRLFRPLLLSSVLFKLSIFQRDHAQKKVYSGSAFEIATGGMALRRSLTEENRLSETVE
jgi:hypothetical protein